MYSDVLFIKDMDALIILHIVQNGSFHQRLAMCQ